MYRKYSHSERSKRHWKKKTAENKTKKIQTHQICSVFLFIIIHNHLQLSICPAATSSSNKRAFSSESHKNEMKWLRSSVRWNLEGKHHRTKLYTRQPSHNTALVGYKNSFFDYAPAWAKKWLAATTQLLLPYKNTIQTKAGRGLKLGIATLFGSHCRYR